MLVEEKKQKVRPRPRRVSRGPAAPPASPGPKARDGATWLRPSFTASLPVAVGGIPPPSSGQAGLALRLLRAVSARPSSPFRCGWAQRAPRLSCPPPPALDRQITAGGRRGGGGDQGGHGHPGDLVRPHHREGALARGAARPPSLSLLSLSGLLPPCALALFPSRHPAALFCFPFCLSPRAGHRGHRHPRAPRARDPGRALPRDQAPHRDPHGTLFPPPPFGRAAPLPGASPFLFPAPRPHPCFARPRPRSPC